MVAPPVFWSPYNGGHWYVPDGTLAREVFTDQETFSSQMLMLPREFNPPKGQGFTPIHMDQPEHAVYRNLLLNTGHGWDPTGRDGALAKAWFNRFG